MAAAAAAAAEYQPLGLKELMLAGNVTTAPPPPTTPNTTGMSKDVSVCRCYCVIRSFRRHTLVC